MLRPDTEHVWHHLEHQVALAGFVLIGGSAITLHIHHRLSEDLDFAWAGPRLPRASLDVLRRTLSQAGLIFQRDDDPAAADEFEIAGMDLHDHQQDFLVSGKVKVSFFTADEPLTRVLSEENPGTGPRIASLDELFASKCLVAASRSKSRDWFDLYYLMTRHDYTLETFHATFAKAGIPGQFDLAMQRLCSGRPSLSDEGFEQIVPDAPSLEDMRDYFIRQRDQYEQALARRELGPE